MIFHTKISEYAEVRETFFIILFNPLSANPTKWSNTLKQFVGFSRRIILSVFDHFVGFHLKD